MAPRPRSRAYPVLRFKSGLANDNLVLVVAGTILDIFGAKLRGKEVKLIPSVPVNFRRSHQKEVRESVGEETILSQSESQPHSIFSSTGSNSEDTTSEGWGTG